MNLENLVKAGEGRFTRFNFLKVKKIGSGGKKKEGTTNGGPKKEAPKKKMWLRQSNIDLQNLEQ